MSIAFAAAFAEALVTALDEEAFVAAFAKALVTALDEEAFVAGPVLATFFMALFAAVVPATVFPMMNKKANLASTQQRTKPLGNIDPHNRHMLKNI